MNIIEMNIEIPITLKRKMDQFPNTDWSAVTCDAFRQTLQQLEYNSIHKNTKH